MIYCDGCKHFDECPILGIGDFCGLEYFESNGSATIADGVSSDEAEI